MSSPPSKLFLSYSSSDTTLAAAFKAHLEKEISGLEVFMASESIEKGEDWESSVHSNLRESFASVSIITKKWQASRWCFAEWMAASVLGKHILPFVDINVDLRAELSKRQNIRFNKERPDFGSATEWISKLLKKQKADLTKSPIPWAFQYQSDDAELFCGREKEIDGIVSQLNSIRHSRDRGPLLVHGSSGSGKSALIRAGVYPMLLNDKAREPWVVATLFKTSKEPFDDLLKSLTQAIERIGISKAVVARSIRGISAATVVECVAGLLKGKPLVLIIDNLDRYLDDGNNQSERLFELLRSVISLESAYMIGVLRSDKIQRAAEVLNIAPSDLHSWAVTHQDPTNWISELNSLLRRKGYDYDPSLIQSLYHNLGDCIQAWPLVGCCLNNLWEKAENKQTAFRQSRGTSEIVSNVVLPTIERAGRQLDPREEQFLRFLALEGISRLDDRKIVWGPIRWARVPQEFNPTMEFLVQKFLLASGGAPAERIAEVVPAVIEQFWPKARIMEYAKESEELREAKRAAEQWKMNDRQSEWLMHRGNRLARVKTFLNQLRTDPALNQLSETDRVLKDYLSECEEFNSLW